MGVVIVVVVLIVVAPVCFAVSVSVLLPRSLFPHTAQFWFFVLSVASLKSQPADRSAGVAAAVDVVLVNCCCCNCSCYCCCSYCCCCCCSYYYIRENLFFPQTCRVFSRLVSVSV